MSIIPEPWITAGLAQLADPPDTDTAALAALAPWLRANERATRIDDIQTALLRAQTCHGRHDPNQHLFSQIEQLLVALEDDARLRVTAAAAGLDDA